VFRKPVADHFQTQFVRVGMTSFAVTSHSLDIDRGAIKRIARLRAKGKATVRPPPPEPSDEVEDDDLNEADRLYAKYLGGPCSAHP
jgi:hypothetical protein